MIALDSSVVIAWLNRLDCRELRRAEELITQGSAVIAPVVLAEVLSGPNMTAELFDVVSNLPLLSLSGGYWVRSGLLRSNVLRLGRKASLGDTLIAQACIDADVALLTRDADFAVFVEVGGLRLA